MQPIYPDYSQYTDKHKVKKVVAKHIAQAREYAYFTLPEQIDSFKWELLPPLFVVKSATKSELVIVKTDKINIPETKEKVKTWLQYGGVIIENFIGKTLKEYRLCFENGSLQYIETQGIRFDEKWNDIFATKSNIPKPMNLQNIIDRSKILLNLVVNPPPIVIIDIYNRELKTCCKLINDLFFGKYEFITEVVN